MKKLEKMWAKISNTPTFLSICAGIYLIITTTGIWDIPESKWNTIIKAVAGLMVAFGIFSQKGNKTIYWDDKPPKK